jgi:hypothetical protein
MKHRISKNAGKTNTLIASLVLQRGLIGAASQWLVHTVAFATGRQSGHRTCEGIRRSVSH